MEILLDTQTLIWALNDIDRLPDRIQNIILDTKNTIYYSFASLWEIEMKHNKKPSLFKCNAKDVFEVINGMTDFVSLDLRTEYLLELNSIIKQEIHKDPFDHLILSTAKSEKMSLITSDELIKKYKDVFIIGY